MTQWGLDTLFNPAKRHMDEEKRRLQSTREEVGDSSGGKRIDLESGRVTIRKSDAGEPDEPADESAETAEAETAEAENAEEKPAKNKPAKNRPATKKATHEQAPDPKPAEPKAKRAMTPAAKRAAERRARLRD